MTWSFMLVLFFIFCHLFQFTLSISSNDSDDFNADAFLNLPSGQLLQYPTTPQSENREGTSKKSNYIRPRNAQEPDIIAPVSKEKKSKQEYKLYFRIRNPILQKQQQKRDYERKKNVISKMNEEERKRQNINIKCAL